MQHALSHYFFTCFVYKCPRSCGNFGGVPDDSLDSIRESHAFEGVSTPSCWHIRFAALVAFVAGARRFFWHGPSLARTFALQLWASKFQGKPVLSHCRKHDLPVVRQLWVSQQQGTPIMSNCGEHELQAFWAFTSFATMVPLGNISSRFEQFGCNILCFQENIYTATFYS